MDENVPVRLVGVLQSLGHDVEHLSLGSARGLSDEEVIDAAIQGGRMIVTQDLDFGRLYYFHHRGQVGMLVLRMSRLTFAGMEKRVREFLEKTDLEARGFHRSLVVLEAHRHRVLR